MPILAVIGCGSISRFHLRAFTETGATVAMVCDPRLAVAQEQAVRFTAVATADWREALSHPAIDAVAIFTPSPYHMAIAQAALEAGMHVMCEKTLTLSAADSLTLTRLAAAATGAPVHLDWSEA